MPSKREPLYIYIYKVPLKFVKKQKQQAADRKNEENLPKRARKTMAQGSTGPLGTGTTQKEAAQLSAQKHRG